MRNDEKEMFKHAVAMNMATQYGNHSGYDALQYAEMTAPHPDLMGQGRPKGDNNRKPGSQKQGADGYFTVGRRY